MRGEVPVICPTSQVKAAATNWHDGQIRSGSRTVSPQLAPDDPDQIDRTIRIPDLDGPFAVRFKRILDVAGQPLGRKPRLSIIAKFFAELVIVGFAIGDAEKVSGHC